MSQPKIPKVEFRTLAKYKYLVTKAVTYETRVRAKSDTAIEDGSGNLLVLLAPSGLLTVYPGYAWDGPSGPTIDTDDWFDASLVHDILYQMMRRRLLPVSKRRLADREMHRILLESQMPRARAWWSFWAVRIFGLPAAHPYFRSLVDGS